MGALVIEIISIVVLFPVNKRLIGYGYGEQVADVLPSLILTLLMCVGIWICRRVIPLAGMVLLLTEVLLGMAVYLGLSMILKNDNLIYIVKTAKEIVKK